MFFRRVMILREYRNRSSSEVWRGRMGMREADKQRVNHQTKQDRCDHLQSPVFRVHGFAVLFQRRTLK